MADRDPMAEAAALAETLRSTIADLDAHIERRAREIAERRPPTVSDAMLEAMGKIEAAGETMRQHMLEKVPEGEGQDFLAAMPPIKWKWTAAQLLMDICDEERRQHEKREGGSGATG
ncbi:hypothetical protein ACIBG4_40620 [Nonomuraea sp. NPDC050383]|uniref:hypothetical protein n=1 Tax=Nonomuraea sp. NPDC050383 TaxID=3364362 RepID=UPI0037AD78FB